MDEIKTDLRKKMEEMKMTYEAKNFDNLLGTEGFSDKLLTNHFTLYQGYVNNTNKIIELMFKLIGEDKANTPEFAELKRRFGWEFNGMRLHELYFGNMSREKKELDQDSALFKNMVETFGSGEKTEKAFKAVGTMRGIGWTILCYDPAGKKLFNIWVNEHDTGHLATTVPLLIMDVFEHAFITDYGLKRAEYIDTFIKAIDWGVVNKRFNGALKQLVL